MWKNLRSVRHSSWCFSDLRAQRLLIEKEIPQGELDSAQKLADGRGQRDRPPLPRPAVDELPGYPAAPRQLRLGETAFVDDEREVGRGLPHVAVHRTRCRRIVSVRRSTHFLLHAPCSAGAD